MAQKKYTVAETGPRIEEFLNNVFKLAGFQLAFTVAEGETPHPDFENPDLMVRFTEIARELQALLNRPEWKAEDKTHLSTRIQALLAAVGTYSDPDVPYDPRDEDIHTATESQLFAILDEELGS